MLCAVDFFCLLGFRQVYRIRENSTGVRPTQLTERYSFESSV